MPGFGLWNLWFHLLSLLAYFGSVAGLLFLFLPGIEKLQDPRVRDEILARGLRMYNMLQIGSLGVLVMSGAFNLTVYKAKGPGLLLGPFGARLAWKLALVFVLVLLSVYQAMAVAHPAVRRHLSGEPLSNLDALIHKLRSTSWAILILTAAVTYMGLGLSH